MYIDAEAPVDQLLMIVTIDSHELDPLEVVGGLTVVVEMVGGWVDGDDTVEVVDGKIVVLTV